LVNKNCIPLSNSPFRSGNKVLAQGHITPRISGAALLRPAACDCYEVLLNIATLQHFRSTSANCMWLFALSGS
jgi:hypothetical protein